MKKIKLNFLHFRARTFHDNIIATIDNKNTNYK
jgi:hypothetical protein